MCRERLHDLIERRLRELDLNPPTFVHRLGYENITRTHLQKDRERGP